ncbi:porin [Cupriavidus pauculus]|uniref:Porin domain-containing protein n=1 Tax=Cupriavidus pauculus TaxID=82633 RepID=A0A2N5C8J2_9BURK|nr:porin [Cupriavidus pauculus]PLP98521.1 hypothetical protein CYJ10_21815 [Cupriavidus pauculus]
MRHLIRLSTAVAAMAVSVPVLAQDSQLGSIYASNGTGFGAQALGIAPGRNIVSLYGTVDMAINYIRAGSQSQVRMQSGNVWTSKFGIYGQEDLGQGWTTFFRLESGFAADTGAVQDSKSFFNRASYIGMHSRNYGQLVLGRQYTSIGSAAIGADPFLANGHESVHTYLLTTSGLGGAANTDAVARLNQTIRYISPRILNVSLDASLSFKGDRSVGTSMHAKTLSANYSDGATMVGVGYGQSYCDPAITGSCTSTDAAAPTLRTDTWIVSALHDFGAFVGQAAWLRFDPKAPGAHTADLYTVGAQRMVGRNFFRIGLAYRHTTADQNYAYGGTVGVDHFLSKRTALYARVSVLKNGPKSSLIYDYDTTNVPVSAGNTVSDASIGMYHNF